MESQWVRGQPGYPAGLEELDSPPPRLWVRGIVEISGPRVAIVGTRRCSERGRYLASRLAERLAAEGVTIISGGALGIDGAAHEGALAARGRTWVILPSPLHRPAPARHRRLFDKIIDGGGAWITEVQQECGRHTFFMRNRLVAALAHVVVVVEAQDRSGTQHTVDFARSLRRPLGAFPWAVGETYGAACLAALKQGAHLVTEAEDVLQMLKACGAPGVEQSSFAAPVDPLLTALAGEEVSPEVLSARLGWPLAQVLVRLTTLELRGRVRAVSGGRFVGVAVTPR